MCALLHRFRRDIVPSSRPTAPVRFLAPQVDALAVSMARPMQSVSMGSSEGFDMADRALHLAAKQG